MQSEFATKARRVAVRAQLLDGSATSVLDTVRRLGFLQMDPIATVATPQQLVLFSRLGPFDAAELDRLLWEERKLFEWDAFIYPVEDLPLVRARMARAGEEAGRSSATIGCATSCARTRASVATSCASSSATGRSFRAT